MKTSKHTYVSQRLDEWIDNLDPQMIDAYDLPIQINLQDIEREEINPIRSVLNKLYETAKQFDLRVVFSNPMEHIRLVSEKHRCNHMMESCRQPLNYTEDFIQKLVAISNQTRDNGKRITVILR